MGIKAVLPNLDDVQDGMKELYKETDGKFILDVDGFDDHPTVRGVIVANKTNKEKRDEYKSQVEALQSKLSGIPDDFDPESYAEMLERLEKNQAPDVDEKLAKQRAKLEDKYGKEISGYKGELTAMKSSLERMVVDDGLSRAMDEAMIDPLHKKKLLPFLKSEGKISVESEGDAFKAVVDTDLGPVSLKQFVTEWAQSDDGKPYIAKSTGPKPRGGDGRGGTNTIKRAEFDAMSNTDRSGFLREGGKVVD